MQNEHWTDWSDNLAEFSWECHECSSRSTASVAKTVLLIFCFRCLYVGIYDCQWLSTISCDKIRKRMKNKNKTPKTQPRQEKRSNRASKWNKIKRLTTIRNTHTQIQKPNIQRMYACVRVCTARASQCFERYQSKWFKLYRRASEKRQPSNYILVSES